MAKMEEEDPICIIQRPLSCQKIGLLNSLFEENTLCMIYTLTFPMCVRSTYFYYIPRVSTTTK